MFEKLNSHLSREGFRVDTELFECDLYELLAGKEKAKMQFVGDYMLDYSWAEERMGQLNKFVSAFPDKK